MHLDDFIKIVLSAGSLAAGAFLAAIRAKLTATKHKNKLHFVFYGFCAVVIASAIIGAIYFRRELGLGGVDANSANQNPNWFAIIVLFLATVAALALAVFTWLNPVGKNQFTSSELDPVVNDFSTQADKENIKLLAGNLDFLGTLPSQLDAHKQYQVLRTARFDEIQILCTAPKTVEDKMRYGKIVTDMPQTLLRFYKSSAADLKVRGRIKTVGGMTRLLIYRKLPTGLYEALELDTAENNGALYSRLWNLMWDMADAPKQEILNEYKALNLR